jgi:hypothetical protein
MQEKSHISRLFGNMKTILAILLLNTIICCTYAQKGLLLTSRYSGKQKFLPEGTKILYGYTSISTISGASIPQVSRQNHTPLNAYLTYRPIMGRGAFHILNDSTIQIDKEVIPLKNLYMVSKRKRFNLRPFLFTIGGTVLMISSINTKIDADQRVNPVVLGLGAGLLIAGVVDSFNSIPKTTSVWRIEVVK